MNRSKNDLKAALQPVATPASRDIPESVESEPVEQSHRRPSRRDKKLIAGHFEKAVHFQLKVICLETDSTIQELLSDSLNLLFEKHDKEPIA